MFGVKASSFYYMKALTILFPLFEFAPAKNNRQRKKKIIHEQRFFHERNYAIIFSKDTDSLMANFNDYRIAAREELGLESINLNKDVCFISRVSTKELCDQENIN